jgi:inner membrane protein
VDTLTHALSGALLARAAAPARHNPEQLNPKARAAAGFAAAAFPDIDFALRLADTLAYLNWHQGVTHSIVLLPLWAYALAHLFSRLTRRRHPWQAFFVPAALGITAHIAGDVLTTYGTALFAPLSAQRYALPLAFMIDPYFTAILAVGLAAMLLRPPRRGSAVITLAVLAGYVGLQAALHQRALEAGRAYARAAQLSGAAVHALPQPLTPFNWKIIVSHGDRHDEAFVNLWRTQKPRQPAPGDGLLRRIAAGYQPVATAEWTRHTRYGTAPSQIALAREAWNQEAFADFRRFARFPALERIETDGGRVCAWFLDLRFTLPALTPSFRYGMCRAADAERWRRERMRGSFWID